LFKKKPFLIIFNFLVRHWLLKLNNAYLTSKMMHDQGVETWYSEKYNSIKHAKTHDIKTTTFPKENNKFDN